MGKINLLSFEVANLIAAGEVVDRPASAVKELLENAVDSGADQITCEIQRGGVSFIRVSDNGCGMEKDDLVPAITRHSTSKIHTAADLSSILTLGFRGEALAAIASVSRLRIFSKTPGSEMGALLEAEGGQVKSVSDTGCADGTTVIAEDLFFNVPARRKFLKKDSTEAVAIGAVAEKIALSHPEISFKFISDGEIRFLTSGSGDLKEVIWALFGKDTARRSLPVDRTEGGIRVSGFVSESDLCRSNRNMENFFINGRYIKSKTASAAVEQAYSSKIPADRFPFCVLNLELNPAAVDVNVHPAKLEVKFADEKRIFDAVYYAVLSALERDVKRPAFPLPADGKTEDLPAPSSAPRPAAKKPDPAAAFVPMDVRPPKPDQVRMSERTGNLPGILEGSSSPRPEATREEIVEAHRRAAENIRGAAAAFANAKRGTDRGPSDPDALRTPLVPDPDQPTPAEIASALLRMEDGPLSPGRSPRNEGGKPAPEQREERAEQTKPEQPDAPAKDPEVPAPEEPVPAPGHPAAPSDAPSSDDPYAVYDREILPGEVPDYLLIGEVFKTYLIVQLEDRILLVDKHAAHERILFDELCRKLRRRMRDRAGSGKTAAQGQMLMVPLEARLYSAEAEAMEEYRPQAEALGFAYEIGKAGGASVSERAASISQIPDELDRNEALELFHVLADRLSDATGTVESAARGFFESRLWQAACKAAVKGGRIYGEEHMRWICDRLLTKPTGDGRGSVIRTCPHGRPVAFEIRKSAIERQFGRTGG